MSSFKLYYKPFYTIWVKVMSIFKEAITKEQLDTLFDNLKYSLSSLLFIATLMTMFIYGHESNGTIFVWFFLVVAISYIRYSLKRIYREDEHPDVNAYHKKFVVLVAMSALIFSSVIYLVSPKDLLAQIIVIFMVAGLSAGAISTLSYSKTSVILFQSLLILPVAIRLILIDNNISIFMGFVLIFYLLVIIRLSLRTYRTYLHVIRLKEAYERKQKDLSIQSQRFYYLYNNIPIGIFFYDERLKLVECNETFAKLLGVKREQLIGLEMSTLKDKRIIPTLKKPFEHKNGVYVGEYFSTLTNNRYFLELHTTFIEVQGKIVEGLGVVIDHTKLKEYQDRVERLAYYDELTHLAKRSILFENLDLAIKKAKRDRVYSVLIYMDLDDFKEINDTLGHNIGDLYLQEIARRIRKYVREVDIAARMGGDEFAVLLLEASNDKHQALIKGVETANRLIDVTSRPAIIEEHTVQTTLSIGIVLINGNFQNGYEVIKFVDSAMFKIKKRHKNSIQIFDEELKEEIDKYYRIKKELERALKNHEFELYLQPQVDRAKNIVGAEALLRWNHPERGLVYPNEFLPVAQEFGMMQRVSEEVLLLAKKILKQLPKNIMVAVNIAGSDIYNVRFFKFLKKLFTTIDPTVLDLEITEQILIEDTKRAIEVINLIKKEYNVHFSIDDFGTGYSSLQYLKQLDVDKLKIDMSFVKDMLEDKSDYVIVETTVNMAKSLKLQTVAEGVETKEHFEELKKLGVDYFQGYYFAKPMPVDEFVQLLRT